MEVTPPAHLRPAYRRPGLLGLVVLGGAVGTTARWELGRLHPVATGTFPWTTFWINVTGSLLLGLLLESLARSGPDHGWRRALRLGIGTGVMGGYTTYSTFMVESDLLIRAGRVGLATAYVAGSVAAGVLAALVGILAARALVRRPA
ncbi:CrcB family protein [Cellulomonas sp. NTE-D12]|uniref:fluoride efflux transporter FluC n=1 Tax=Cellulomonas sp. NTE-D12 TaxID=2962632 RepID=UPI003081B2D6|nr:hypothetical protein CELD12_07630 [Cellulomonas sp. NTE-D12]